MPSFTTDGRRYFVSFITGPSHVRLGIEWAAEPEESVALERLLPIGGCEHGELTETLVAESVDAGIAEANRRLGVAYRPARILYVANDSPRYDLFQHCASLLVQRHADGEHFEKVDP